MNIIKIIKKSRCNICKLISIIDANQEYSISLGLDH